MAYFNLLDIDALSNELKNNLEYYRLYGEPIVLEYSKDLDDKVRAVRNYLDLIRLYDLDFDIPSLLKIVIDLSSTIYFTNSNLLQLSLLDDMSGIKYKDKYNEIYTNMQGASLQENRKYTAEQLRSLAENGAITEKLINFIYSHAAKELLGKIDSAYELLKAVSKSLSGCIQSMQTYGIGSKWQT